VKHNTIDDARVLKVLRDVGYRGDVEVEFVWLDWERCNEVDNITETILLRDSLLTAWQRISKISR
jgi:hypothetical protein